MAFTKEYEYKLEIEGDREIYVRKATVIKEDGDVVGRSFERYSVKPGAAYDAEPEMIRTIAAALHTADAISAYQAAASAEEEG
jgi:hypothetical protein